MIAQALANDSAFVRVAKGVYALRALAGSVTPAYKSPGRSRRENLRPPRPPRAPAATLLLEAFEDDFDGEEEEEVRAALALEAPMVALRMRRRRHAAAGGVRGQLWRRGGGIGAHVASPSSRWLACLLQRCAHV